MCCSYCSFSLAVLVVWVEDTWYAEIRDYQHFCCYYTYWEFCAKLCYKYTFWYLSISTNMVSFSLWLYLSLRITRNTVPWNSNLMVDLMDLFTAQLVFSLYCKDLFLLERELHKHRWTILWMLINIQGHHVNFYLIKHLLCTVFHMKDTLG